MKGDDERQMPSVSVVSSLYPPVNPQLFLKCSEDDETVQPEFEQNGTAGKKHS